MRISPLILAVLLAVSGPFGGARAQPGAVAGQVVQTSAPAPEPPAADEERPGSRPHPAVWIAIGVAIGLVVLIAAISDGGVGFPDTSPGNLDP